MKTERIKIISGAAVVFSCVVLSFVRCSRIKLEFSIVHTMISVGTTEAKREKYLFGWVVFSVIKK